MRCISEELIQKFIDGETTVKEETIINNHVQSCSKCSERIKEQRMVAGNIIKLIHDLDEKDVAITKFIHSIPPKRSFPSKLKIWIYSSAASLLILLFIIFPKQQEHSDTEIEIDYSFDLESDFNANLPVSEQEMVIQIIDSDGKLTQY